ncbi:hypothetical protein [Hydromonas duriensis]|uniref:DUF4136 domain-containing protein n=1 Tax=Hydromonas duriensis TaxID=1527608 RepID=A0A4R6Y8E1_9BURK|nr:hypothetical protein [Hydromonas duriensis]TDR31652.1 hypothetical protein DFR44_10835 [Hydromonas duriensis]
MNTLSRATCLATSLLLSACAGLHYTPPVIPSGVATATISYYGVRDEDMQLITNSTCQPRSYYGRKDVYSMGYASHAVADSPNEYRVPIEADKPFVASGVKDVLIGYTTRWYSRGNGFLAPEQEPVYARADIMPMVFTPKAGHHYVVGVAQEGRNLMANITMRDLGTADAPYSTPVDVTPQLIPAFQCISKP